MESNRQTDKPPRSRKTRLNLHSFYDLSESVLNNIDYLIDIASAATARVKTFDSFDCWFRSRLIVNFYTAQCWSIVSWKLLELYVYYVTSPQFLSRYSIISRYRLASLDRRIYEFVSKNEEKQMSFKMWRNIQIEPTCENFSLRRYRLRLMRSNQRWFSRKKRFITVPGMNSWIVVASFVRQRVLFCCYLLRQSRLLMRFFIHWNSEVTTTTTNSHHSFIRFIHSFMSRPRFHNLRLLHFNQFLSRA